MKPVRRLCEPFVEVPRTEDSAKVRLVASSFGNDSLNNDKAPSKKSLLRICCKT